MKKLLGMLAITTTLVMGCAGLAFGGNITRVYLNNNKLLMTTSPFIKDGTTYVPIRTLSDNIGAKLTWNAADSTFKVVYGIYNVTMRINNNTIHINDTARKLSAPAILKNGSTYVPVRFLKEAFGAELSYNQKTNEVFVNLELPKDGGQQYDSYGRLLRKTNLPSNANSFPYILNGVPNSFYTDLDFYYNRVTWKITPVEGKNFEKPVNIGNQKLATQENIRIWTKNYEKNLDLRLNVDYRTVDNNWINSMMNTYPSRYGIERGDFKDGYTVGYKRELNDYIQYMKKNHLVIEGDYYVEPSTTYLCTGSLTIRCWFKFRINSDKVKEADVYEKYDVKTLKTNTWYTGYHDMTCGSNNMGSDGSDFTIDSDNLDIDIIR